MLNRLAFLISMIIGLPLSAQQLRLETGVYVNTSNPGKCVAYVRQVNDSMIVIQWTDNGPDFHCDKKSSEKYVRALRTERFFRDGDSKLDGLEIVDSKTILFGFNDPVLLDFQKKSPERATLFQVSKAIGWKYHRATDLCSVGGSSPKCGEITEQMIRDQNLCENATKDALSQATSLCQMNYPRGQCDIEGMNVNIFFQRYIPDPSAPEGLPSLLDGYGTGCEVTVAVRAKI